MVKIISRGWFFAMKLILWLQDWDTLIEQPLIWIMTNGDKPPAHTRSWKSQDGKLQSHLEWPNHAIVVEFVKLDIKPYNLYEIQVAKGNFHP